MNMFGVPEYTINRIARLASRLSKIKTSKFALEGHVSLVT
jgi:hypothetical protein